MRRIYIPEYFCIMIDIYVISDNMCTHMYLYICTYLHSGFIRNIKAIRLNDTSIFVNWTISQPSYTYTVIWTNLNTGVMGSYTVPENTNSYTITRLNDNTYNVSVTAMGACGMRTSDPITVDGECT